MNYRMGGLIDTKFSPYVDLLKNKLGVPNLRNGKWPLKSVRPEFGSSP